MPNQIKLGACDDGQLRLDVATFLDTRMLIQANSGGGKSWLLRLLAERIAGEVPTIVFDPEGEFASLREKIDLVLVGESGELKADVRAAGVLARKLLELRLSAVLDLYELKMHDRRRFVRLFLESLMEAPKKLWQPTLLLLDEAHLFCPERSFGDAESAEAVIDIASRGRKRGFCLVAATQRLSQLHKGCAAELNNVCIGRTTLDVDAKRALDVLGMTASEKTTLRDLGEEVSPKKEFFAYGPAFDCKGVARFVSDQVSTTHPKSGHKRAIAPPAPSKRIKGVLGELADLSKKADEEIRTLQQAQAEVVRLKKELAAAVKAQAKTGAGTASPAKAIGDRDLKQQEAWWRKEHRRLGDQYERNRKMSWNVAQRLHKLWEQLQGEVITAIQLTQCRLYQDPSTPPAAMVDGAAQCAPKLVADGHVPPVAVVDRSSPAAASKYSSPSGSDIAGGGVAGLGKAERLILRAFYWLRDEAADAAKVAFYSGYSSGSGGFNNALGRLRSAGLISGWQITDAGIAAMPTGVEPKPTGPELREWLRPKLGKAENSLLDALVAAYPERLDNAALSVASGYSDGSGGFNNALGKLRTIEAAVGYAREGGTKAADVFFEGV